MVLGFHQRAHRAPHLTPQAAHIREAELILNDGLRLPHVLVSIAGEPGDLELIRHGRLLAGLLDSRLTLLYAFRPATEERERVALARDRQYARLIGAPLIELPAYSAVAGIAEYAQTRGVTHIVMSAALTGARSRFDLLVRAFAERPEAIDF